MSFLITKELTKIYDTGDAVPKTAVDDVNLEISSGCFTVLSGPSGSGKTTLLNLIGGLDLPTKGSVHVAGQEISTLPERDLSRFRLHSIGFIFQAYNLVPVLTARENMEYVMILQGVSETTRNSKILEVTQRLGIEDLLERKPFEMSGGQQQRVAVARALLGNPQIILADEPTANLDSVSSRELLELMRELNESQGMSFLISSHDPMVLDVARESIFLQDGRLGNAEDSSH